MAAILDPQEKMDQESIIIDAAGMHYRLLNERIRNAIAQGYREIVLNGVNGQRYIADGLISDVRMVINGVPGNDLGAFMDGPTVVVNDNAQDGVGNTMNNGTIVVRGNAGDVVGYGMRGGRIFVKGDVGYRVGIHMKSFKEQVPVIVAGGRAGDFFGEYMAGGVLVLLGFTAADAPLVGNYLGTGMHGGTIFIRGEPEESQLGREVRVFSLRGEDEDYLGRILDDFAEETGTGLSGAPLSQFRALRPYSHRPYGGMYVY